MLSHTDLILRIAVGAFLGGVIGLERDFHGRQAGLRTHLIVAMASATFMVISIQFPFLQNFSGEHSFLRADVSHIAAAIVSGVGFLASGTILRSGFTIQGLTTAAGLWLVTAMGFVTLTILRLLESKNDMFIEHHIVLTLRNESNGVEKVMSLLDAAEAKVSSLDYKKEISSQETIIMVELGLPGNKGVYTLLELLEKQDGVQKIHVRLRKTQ